MRLDTVIFFLVLYLNNVYTTNQINSCTTSSGQSGKCIPIRECPHLYSLLNEKPLSTATVDYLRKAHCGFQAGIPKICCNDLSTNGMKQDKIEPRYGADDVLPDPDDCGIDSGTKLIGGKNTKLDDFPWMALISYINIHSPKLKEFHCGGALISKRYVLTAGHCVKENETSSWNLTSVRLGEYNKESDEDCYHNGYRKVCLPSPPIDVEVEEIIPHEKYNPNDRNMWNDIALLRLKRDVSFSDYIRPICLAFSEEDKNKTYAGLNLTVAGWGQTATRSSSSVKQKLEVPVQKNERCNSFYRDIHVEIAETQLCAGGERNQDTCHGDSGGPLMTIAVNKNGDAAWFCVGVVSFGPKPCAFEDWPAVYTRVSKYFSWIVKNMKP